ncbi:MAG: cytochrome D1 domain-containing protein [Steroidobacteraceae bacterium]
MSTKLRFACVSLFASAALAMGGSAMSAERPKTLLAVVSKGLPGISLFDAATDRLHCQVKMDVAPHEAAFSRDGRLLVVPVYSSANIGQPGPDGHTINFVRTADCSIEHALDTSPVKRPHYVELGQRSGLFYVTAERDKSILVVDAKRHAIVDSLPTGSDKTHFFALSRDERRIYTSNVSDNTLSVLDVQGREVLATVNVGTSNQRMTLSPDGKWFVTSLWQAGRIAVHRTSDNALDFEIPIEGAPFVARFSPDGRTLYNMGMPPAGAGPGGIRVWRIDVATRQVAGYSTEDLGAGTGGLQVNPVNGQLYLSAYSGKVSVLDPVTLKLLRQFDAGETPDGLFFSRK